MNQESGRRNFEYLIRYRSFSIRKSMVDKCKGLNHFLVRRISNISTVILGPNVWYPLRRRAVLRLYDMTQIFPCSSQSTNWVWIMWIVIYTRVNTHGIVYNIFAKSLLTWPYPTVSISRRSHPWWSCRLFVEMAPIPDEVWVRGERKYHWNDRLHYFWIAVDWHSIWYSLWTKENEYLPSASLLRNPPGAHAPANEWVCPWFHRQEQCFFLSSPSISLFRNELRVRPLIHIISQQVADILDVTYALSRVVVRGQCLDLHRREKLLPEWGWRDDG